MLAYVMSRPAVLILLLLRLIPATRMLRTNSTQKAQLSNSTPLVKEEQGQPEKTEESGSLDEIFGAFKVPLSDSELQAVSYAGQESRRVIVLTTSNGKFVNMTRNLLASMKKVGRDTLMVLCEDNKCMEELQEEPGLTAISTGRNLEMGSYNGPNWNRFMQRKPVYVQSLLDRGFAVLWTDSDIAWLRDPIEALERQQGTFLVQDDTNKDQWAWSLGLTSSTPMSLREPCAGFFLVRPGAATQDLMQDWIGRLKRDAQLHDQWALGQLFLEDTKACSLELQNCGEEPGKVLLPRSTFVTGAVKRKDWEKDAVIYHANWRKGNLPKMCILLKHELWDQSAGHVSPSCQEGKDTSVGNLDMLQALPWAWVKLKNLV